MKIKFRENYQRFQKGCIYDLNPELADNIMNLGVAFNAEPFGDDDPQPLRREEV